jgi:hypothetical protein
MASGGLEQGGLYQYWHPGFTKWFALTAKTGALIRVVTTVVCPIAQISLVHTQMIATFKPALRTIATTREARGTMHLITHIPAVPVTITAEVRCNTVATCTLECSILENSANTCNTNVNISKTVAC